MLFSEHGSLFTVWADAEAKWEAGRAPNTTTRFVTAVVVNDRLVGDILCRDSHVQTFSGAEASLGSLQWAAPYAVCVDFATTVRR